MNAKISVLVIYVEAIIYLLLYNLHDCTFKRTTKSFGSHPFTIASVPPLFFSVFVFFAFLFRLLFLLSLTLISIIYCFNYTSLLLHLFTTHLLSHPFLSSVIFIISTLIIGIFYCLNYTSLLLRLFCLVLCSYLQLDAKKRPSCHVIILSLCC